MYTEFKEVHTLMGNVFELTLVAEQAAEARQGIARAVAEIARIEALLTTFKESSETNLVNAAAGVQPVPVSREVFQLIERSQKISRITDGAFDLSYGSIDKSLWNFDRQMTSLPDPAKAKAAVQLIDYRNIELNPAERTVFLTKKGMRIGFGGIGKGYAADRAAALLQAEGFSGGLVNASGDIRAWGRQANGGGWLVGISNPDDPAQVFSYLDISDRAIATSGNYEKFVVINGQKYSHTIDPHTGLPVTGIKSVTVLAPTAELADALTTPVTIMGIKAGLSLIDQLPGMACIIIDDHNHLHSSKNIQLT